MDWIAINQDQKKEVHQPRPGPAAAATKKRESRSVLTDLGL